MNDSARSNETELKKEHNYQINKDSSEWEYSLKLAKSDELVMSFDYYKLVIVSHSDTKTILEKWTKYWTS